MKKLLTFAILITMALMACTAPAPPAAVPIPLPPVAAEPAPSPTPPPIVEEPIPVSPPVVEEPVPPPEPEEDFALLCQWVGKNSMLTEPFAIHKAPWVLTVVYGRGTFGMTEFNWIEVYLRKPHDRSFRELIVRHENVTEQSGEDFYFDEVGTYYLEIGCVRGAYKIMVFIHPSE